MDRNDHSEWTGQKLIEEAYAVRQSLDTIEHGPERQTQLRTRLAASAFELLCMELESNGEDPRTVFAFSDVEWFGEFTPAKGLRVATQRVSFPQPSV